MAEDNDTDTVENEDVEKASSKKKLFVILIVLLVVLVGGGVGIWKAGLLSGGEKSGTKASPSKTTLAIPSATANLDNGNGRTIYVKMTASVEVEGTVNGVSLKDKIPAIQDIFQTYLHESRPEDLHGNGFYRLREALLRRLRVALAPVNVTGIYITELLTQ